MTFSSKIFYFLCVSFVILLTLSLILKDRIRSISNPDFSLVLHGYYLDSCDDSRDTIQKEVHYINFEKSRKFGLDIPFNGIVKADKENCANFDSTKLKTWSLKGYKSSSFIFIAYSSNDLVNTGIGNIVLGKQSDHWMGYWIGEDSNKSGQIRKCPYFASSQKNQDLAEVWKYFKMDSCVTIFPNEVVLSKSKTKVSDEQL